MANKIKLLNNYAPFLQKHLGYSDEEMELWMKNPRNQEALLKAPDLLQKTIIIEVVESHGCSSLHKIGDKFYFDGPGNLLTKLNPKRICIFALSEMERLIFAAQELFYAGIDPNELRIKRVGCFDIGLKCGGWGRIILELKFEDRNKVNINPKK
ncbi:MAG: hypothetical protein ACFFAO_04290 [Candidatus Hermodarchaeota archaeon]